MKTFEFLILIVFLTGCTQTKTEIIHEQVKEKEKILVPFTLLTNISATAYTGTIFFKERRCFKAEASAVSWTLGEVNPRGGAWSKYNYFTLEIYNPAKRAISCSLTFKPIKGMPYNERMDKELRLVPGENIIKINLKNVKRNNRTPLDFSAPLFEWYLYKSNQNGVKDVIYLTDVLLD